MQHYFSQNNYINHLGRLLKKFSSLVIDKNVIEKTEIAGPGFINFYFAPIFIAQIVKSILVNPHSYGKSKKYSGKKANVEFVSANPTGPLTVGHGRNAVVGDTIANLLEWVGYKVQREYYFNNAGRQIRVLAASVRIRYMQLNNYDINFPTDYYQGEYIRDIAKDIQEDFGTFFINKISRKFTKQININLSERYNSNLSENRKKFIYEIIAKSISTNLKDAWTQNLSKKAVIKLCENIDLDKPKDKIKPANINFQPAVDIANRYFYQLKKINDLENNIYEIKKSLNKITIKFNEEIKSEFIKVIRSKRNIALFEEIFKGYVEKKIFDEIRNSLKKLKIIFDYFYNEQYLYERGWIEEIITKFKENGLSYEREGATWLKLKELGREDDKVIIKSSGEPTYRLPDIAYHYRKFVRGYDLMVDIFGSDHNATYPDVLAGLKALGYDDSKVKVLIHQFVTITENGEIVKMSTRKANYVTLDQLVDDVGADVVRYFFNMRNINSHMNFDLALAKKQSEENPVFYLQYAHARISSIIRMVEGEILNPRQKI